MRGLGTVTVIHGKGNDDFQVVVNGIVSEEWKRLCEKDIAEKKKRQKEFDDAMELMNFFKKQRNQMRAERTETITRKHEAETFSSKARERIGFVLACFIVWGQAIMPYLVEYVGDEEEEK